MANKGNRIIIANYYFSGGGPIVLSELCAVLRSLGYDAKVLMRLYPIYGENLPLIKRVWRNMINTLIILFMKLNLLPTQLKRRIRGSATVPGLKFKYFPYFNKKNTIVIYPELIWGNPLKAEKVVRWLLYFHKYSEHPNSFSKDDCFISYTREFDDPLLNPEGNLVKINSFNKNLYRQFNFGERNGNCYIIRKGRNRDDLPKSFDGPVFDDNMSDEEFVRILNNCKYCYSYDTYTFYNSIAAVCGCIPIVVLEPGKTINDYLKPDNPHYGVAYGDTEEQIEYAISTRSKRLATLDFEEVNRENTIRLVSILEKKFGKLRKIKQ